MVLAPEAPATATDPPAPEPLRPLPPLVDSFGRRIGDLRVSVTDRCNFRCTYCMPADGLPWIPREELLSFLEIERLTALLVRLGIEEVRLTGGEPTVRPNLPDLVRRLAGIPGLRSLSLTTNGVLLKRLAPELAAAGLTRINVSLDTLDAAKFAAITRRNLLGQVLEGLEALERYPSIRPIKVNAVAIRGFTSEEDVLALARLAREKPYVVRFIEFMPLDAEGNWNMEKVLPGEEIRQIIERRYPLVRVNQDDLSSTSRDWRFADGVGQIGFINPVSQPFCAHCNRIRLTADGQLRTCLFSIDETDLRTLLRSGGSDDDLEQVIRAAVRRKERKHKINEGEAFERASRSMSQIGG